MNDLLARHSVPNAPALGDGDIGSMLGKLAGWRAEAGAIEKTFAFKGGWLETIGFVNAVAWLSQREDHHPDLTVGYDRCTVRYATHSAGGVTMNDFICAAKVDALVAAGA